MKPIKILSGFIAINMALVILAAFIFFVMRPAGEGPAAALLAGGLILLLLGGLASGLIIRGFAPPLNKLIRHLEDEARGLEEAAGRLNGTAMAMAENSARNSAALEEAASRLSKVSALILGGVNNISEARDILAEISGLVASAGESLGEIDKNLRSNTAMAGEVGAEALNLSGQADELIEALGELSALIHGTGGPDCREPSLKSKLARRMLVKALPVAEAS